MNKPIRGLIIAKVILLAMLSIVLYFVVRLAFFLVNPMPIYEKVPAFLLLLAESFVLLHGFGYFLNIRHVLERETTSTTIEDGLIPLQDYPPVAIIVSSFKEPLNVIEDTLICFYNLTYPNKHLYFLDDTRYDLAGDDPEKMRNYQQAVDALCAGIGINVFRRIWHGAKAGMINDFLAFIEGNSNPGFKLLPFSRTKMTMRPKYIIVFDADQNPFPNFVEALVKRMEENKGLAFIQTPQYYSNFESNRVARASGLQQAIFYEYICEGKGLQDAMFCCGTNVIFRREALLDVGGLDESSVTEDFATSLHFHMRGWHSSYLSKVCAFGMGPEDLGGYFKQQFRWALGTVGMFRTICLGFLRNPRRLPLATWWEYFLSGTHYFVGWVFLITVACPILYLFTGVPTYFVSPEFYLLFFSPYAILSLLAFVWTMRERNYSFSEVYFSVLLTPISFPIYIKASTLGLLGFRGKFGITPKGQSHALPLRGLWAQITLALWAFAAIIWGGNRLLYEQQPVWAIVTNVIWCCYFFLVLSTILYFNFPDESELSDEL